MASMSASIVRFKTLKIYEKYSHRFAPQVAVDASLQVATGLLSVAGET